MVSVSSTVWSKPYNKPDYNTRSVDWSIGQLVLLPNPNIMGGRERRHNLIDAPPSVAHTQRRGTAALFAGLQRFVNIWGDILQALKRL